MESSVWADAPLSRSEPRWLRAALGAPAAAVLGVTAGAALLCGVAADSRWLAALGAHIVETGSVPDHLPYATASSADWPNVLAAAQLAFHAVYSSLGDRGLMLAQVLAVALAWSFLASAMRRGGASPTGTAAALLLAGFAAAPALVAVRLQLFSLVAFGLLLALLTAEHAAPSRRIWWLVPLVALWANLHGAVLVGVAAAGAYLLVDRLRRDPATALGVLAASLAALLATPALWRTPAYFAGVLENEAARRGEGLWAPLDPGSLLGLSFLVSAAALLALALRARPAAWQLVAAGGLGIMAIRTERAGVWLAMLLAVPAAAAVSDRRPVRLSGAVAVAMAVLVAVAVVRGPLEFGAGPALVDRAIAAAGDGGVLAEPLLAEQVVAAGGRVWVANALDAFPRPVQAAYLDWAAGRPEGDRALAKADAILVGAGGAPDRRLAESPRFRVAARDGRAVVYVRRQP